MATELRRGRSLKGRTRPPASQDGMLSSVTSTFVWPPVPACSSPVSPSYLQQRADQLQVQLGVICSQSAGSWASQPGGYGLQGHVHLHLAPFACMLRACLAVIPAAERSAE